MVLQQIEQFDTFSDTFSDNLFFTHPRAEQFLQI